MPNATTGANAQAMPETTAHQPNLSPADQRALLLLSRWREQKDAWERLANRPEGTEETCEAGYDRIMAVEHVLQSDLVDSGSMQAAGALLSIEIEDTEDTEPFAGLYRGLLRAIRPYLLGAIAEAADRALVRKEAADPA
jgi:hypothetical protein